MTRNICSVCHGKGSIKNPQHEWENPYGTYMTCPNCQGEGFIGLPDNFPTKKPFYRSGER